jgi:DNA repair protein RAD50
MFQAQEERLLDREGLIHEIATQYSIRGFDVSPLERDQVTDFTTKLGALLAQQTTGVEHIQVHLVDHSEVYLVLTSLYLKDEIQQSNVTYNERSRQLHANLERYKQQRATNRSRIVRISHLVEQSLLTGSLGKAPVRYRIY